MSTGLSLILEDSTLSPVDAWYSVFGEQVGTLLWVKEYIFKTILSHSVKYISCFMC